jgi:hypothetical protein
VDIDDLEEYISLIKGVHFPESLEETEEITRCHNLGNRNILNYI